MDTARLFQSGRSQAVRLPKEYRFEGVEVAVRHFGNGVLLLPVNEPWAMLDAALDAFEKMRTISSYILPEATPMIANDMRQMGFCTPEMERRDALVSKRRAISSISRH